MVLQNSLYFIHANAVAVLNSFIKIGSYSLWTIHHCNSSISLEQWLEHSGKKFCELCKHQFTITPLYAPDMPSNLPLRIVILHSFKLIWNGLWTALRSFIVCFIWLFVVPLVTSSIWRYHFGPRADVMPDDEPNSILLKSDLITDHGQVDLMAQSGFIGLDDASLRFVYFEIDDD